MYICVLGNIGSGKSTLVSRLAEELNIESHMENADGNPLFESYYSEPRRWTYCFHELMLSHRFSSHCLAGVNGGVLDRTLWETDIFANYSNEPFRMNAEELAKYKLKSADLKNILSRVGLIIYLETDVENLLSRISQRGREYEREIDEKFLINLSKGYSKLTETLINEGQNIHSLNTNNLKADEVLTKALEIINTSY
ncbi:MAG: deoxyadenosine/deoxycytidine kinase [Bacteriovoracaceae bacterium]|jgi:deoxyadenosine/deoxycytidine kinase